MNEIQSEIIKYLGEKNKVIFDVGCFRGTFTNNLIKNELKSKARSKFYLFDPNPNVKNYLKKLLKNEKIKYFDLAIDNSNSKKKFFLNEFFEASGSSLQSTIKNDKKWTSTRKIFMQILQPFLKIKDFSEISVQTQTLDNFCKNENVENIDVLKIDAEGNELNILKSAQKLLSSNKIALIYVEISESKDKFDEKEKSVIDFLSNYNFEMKKKLQIKSFSFLSNLKATDNLFLNKDYESKQL
jgi:FkbM family methyltransferase